LSSIFGQIVELVTNLDGRTLHFEGGFSPELRGCPLDGGGTIVASPSDEAKIYSSILCALVVGRYSLS
jgi:hypothetical protein